jgi:hypothetical protein
LRSSPDSVRLVASIVAACSHIVLEVTSLIKLCH